MSRFLWEALINSFSYSLQPLSSKCLVFQHSCPELGFGIAALKTLKQSYVCGHGHNSSSCANSKTKIASLLLQPCRLLNDNKTDDLQWIQGASLLWNSFWLVKEMTNKSLTPEASRTTSRSINIQLHFLYQQFTVWRISAMYVAYHSLHLSQTYR